MGVQKLPIMFQRFKSAIDRTIAEEQARQKEIQQTQSPSGSRPRSVSRTNSSKDSPAKRRPKKPGQEASSADNVPNTDPAVFEAAFALDEEEAEAKLTAEKPATPGENGSNGAVDAVKDAGDTDEKIKDKSADGTLIMLEKADKEESAQSPAELTPEIKAKLRKLEKLEKTYPGMLRPRWRNSSLRPVIREARD